MNHQFERASKESSYPLYDPQQAEAQHALNSARNFWSSQPHQSNSASVPKLR